MKQSPPTPPLSPAQAKRRKDEYDERMRIQARVRGAQHKIIDLCEYTLDRLAPKPEAALSRAAERRQLANMLHAHELCDKTACRRKHACLGQPTVCLRVLMPVLGVDRFDRLIKQRKRRRRTRRER